MTTRRTKGEGGLYQRADGMWIGSVDLGWDAQGKRRRKYVSARTQADALRKLRETKASVERGVVPSTVTVEQWMRRWLGSEPVRALRPRTVEGYRGYVERWIIPVLGRVRLDRLAPQDVDRMLRAMEDAGLAVGSRKQARAVLQAALKVALREELVARNVAALATPPHGPAKHHQHLTMEQARAVLAVLRAHGEAGDWHTCSRYMVALLAGLRQGEALGLTWDHVVLEGEDPRIEVVQTAQRIPGRGMVVGDTKSAASHRVVPLVAPAAAALAAWRADCGGAGFVWGGAAPMDPRRDWQAWRGLLAEAGCPAVPLHGARATTASILFDAGVPDLTVSRILGHSQVQVTREHYVRSTNAQHVAALNAGLAALLEE